MPVYYGFYCAKFDIDSFIVREYKFLWVKCHQKFYSYEAVKFINM